MMNADLEKDLEKIYMSSGSMWALELHTFLLENK